LTLSRYTQTGGALAIRLRQAGLRPSGISGAHLFPLTPDTQPLGPRRDGVPVNRLPRDLKHGPDVGRVLVRASVAEVLKLTQDDVLRRRDAITWSHRATVRLYPSGSGGPRRT